MSFPQAIRSFWKNYANFRGRTPRSGYWWASLFLLASSLILGGIDSALFGSLWSEELLSQGLGPLRFAFALAALVPNLALAFRRLHDTGRSGWWLLLPIVPSLVLWVTAPETASGQPATFGDVDPFVQLIAVAGLAGVVVLFVFYLQKSKPGDNKYGPNPLENPEASNESE